MGDFVSVVVMAIARASDRRICVIRRKSEHDRSDGWVLPGGKIELGESPVDAVLREIGEEVDVGNVYFVKLLGERTHPSTMVKIRYYGCVCSENSDAYIKEPHKFCELRWCSPSKTFDLLGSNIFSGIKNFLDAVADTSTPFPPWK